MKNIIFNNVGCCHLKDVPSGEFFMTYGQLYLKVFERIDNFEHYIKCVNVQTGKLVDDATFSDSTEVIRVNVNIEVN